MQMQDEIRELNWTKINVPPLTNLKQDTTLVAGIDSQGDIWIVASTCKNLL
jgi:hypothetical protein